MGFELSYNCKKCGYYFWAQVGCGHHYPLEYQRIIKKMKEGEFGEQGKEFLEVFPDGAIDCDYIVVQCDDCSNLMEVPDLSLYIPKEGYDPTKQDRSIPWSTAFSGKGCKYVAFFELREHYELFERYDHRCLKCNGHTSVVYEETSDRINKMVPCPECGEILEVLTVGHWA